MFFNPSEMRTVVIDVAKVIERTFQIQNIFFYSIAIIFSNQCQILLHIFIAKQFCLQKLFLNISL